MHGSYIYYGQIRRFRCFIIDTGIGSTSVDQGESSYGLRNYFALLGERGSERLL